MSFEDLVSENKRKATANPPIVALLLIIFLRKLLYTFQLKHQKTHNIFYCVRRDKRLILKLFYTKKASKYSLPLISLRLYFSFKI